MRKLKKEHKDKSGLEFVQHCAQVALDHKAEDVLVLDVHELTSYTDYFILMSGRSTRHVQGLAEILEKEFSSKRISTKNCEGLQEGLWVLLDFNDVVIHIFYKDHRKFYDLDGLWHDAPKIEIEDSEGP